MPHLCACCYQGDPVHLCLYTSFMIQRYRSRISWPCLDRVDIHTEVPAVKFRDFSDWAEYESSASIVARVARSREVQKERFKETECTDRKKRARIFLLTCGSVNCKKFVNVDK